MTQKTIAIIGAGPAGLIAAETLAPHAQVVVLDRMPSPGRKLLMAGRGGLNLTHGAPLEQILSRFGAPLLQDAVRRFPPAELIAWAEGLSQPVFVGSSGRVFPKAMKSSPLLRAWLGRLAALGVELRLRQAWRGWDAAGGLVFEGPDGDSVLRPDGVVLALGGASWPRLGSDGRWQEFFSDDEVRLLVAANMGFRVGWSDVFRTRQAGQPLKRIGLRFGAHQAMGEAMITEHGLEGGVVYALSAPIRDAIAAEGSAVVHVDLRPDVPAEALAVRLAARGSRSLSNHLRSQAGLSAPAVALVQEALHGGVDLPLGALIKALPLRLDAPAGLDRAISSAGGLRLEAVDERFMLRSRPGVFAAGEMLDWEAPTGGYLLQGCFSTGRGAALGLLAWMGER